MRSNNGLLSVPLLLFFTVINTTLTAQIRRNEGAHHGSFYLSAGKNESSFSRSDIHIDQKLLGNHYDMTQVKADNKGTNISLFPWNLNYRLGYYFDYDQSMGIELSYDAVNFHITDDELIPVAGTINDMPNTHKAITFSSKAGYYYSLSGANLLTANFVKRYTLFRPRMNKFAIDGLLKIGAGPVMPRCESAMPYGGAVPHNYDDRQFQYRGLNTGVEAALRFTFFRFLYLEAAAKYDYAMYKGIVIYQGTASQNIATTEIIGSLGFTFPTNKFNPLFYHPRKVITITSLAEAQKKQALEQLQEAEEGGGKKKKEKGEEIMDIPEFQNIIERNQKAAEIADSLQNLPPPEAPADTAAAAQDTTGKAQTEEPKKKKKHRHKKDEENTEAPAVTPPGEAAPAPGEAPPTPPPAEPAPAPTPAPENKTETPENKDSLGNKSGGTETPKPEEEMSKKERKALEKAKKEEERKAEKARKEAEQKAEEEKKEQERIEQEKKDKEEQDKADKEAAEKKKAEDDKAAAKQAEEDAKAQKEKELEDKQAQHEKEMQELKEKREKELEDAKAKREQEKKEREEKLEQEKKEREEKAEQARKEREEKLEQAKKEREEKLEQAKKEREEKLEQMKKEREEKLEQAKKEREEQLEKARKEKEEQQKAKDEEKKDGN